MESVKNKLHMLLHNPVGRDMGVVAFFGLINKLMKKTVKILLLNILKILLQKYKNLRLEFIFLTIHNK
jgi:hypothetical protein